MAEVTPSLAASVIVLRDGPRASGESGYEILMMRRHEAASFVPGAWVFPGGTAEPDDSRIALEHGVATVDAAMRVTAARELFEETGVWLGAPLVAAELKRRQLLGGAVHFRDLFAASPIPLEEMSWTSRWITPPEIARRFDTYFFLAAAPALATASIATDEATELVWITPQAALADLEMVFPTIRNLEAIAGFSSIDELLSSRRGVAVEPVQPRVVGGRIVLP